MQLSKVVEARETAKATVEKIEVAKATPAKEGRRRSGMLEANKAVTEASQAVGQKRNLKKLQNVQIEENEDSEEKLAGAQEA